MSITPAGCYCSLAEAVKALWCNDPYLCSVIPAERFYEYGYSSSEKKPPYAVYRQAGQSDTLLLGDDDHFGIVNATLKIYAGKEIWRLGKQARLLFSNVGCLDSLEGSVCKTRCIPGAALQLTGGVWVVEHTIRMSMTEYRGPERLRME